jgi:hypothetical protein
MSLPSDNYFFTSQVSPPGIVGCVDMAQGEKRFSQLFFLTIKVAKKSKNALSTFCLDAKSGEKNQGQSMAPPDCPGPRTSRMLIY